VAAIRDSEVGSAANVVLFLFFLVGVQLIPIASIAWQALSEESARPALGRAVDWLKAHNRAIAVAASVIFGVIFLANGISGLT
jgi:hypothetical protein